MIKRLTLVVLILSLLLGTSALAGGDGSEACLISEKADYKELRSEFYDLEDNFYKFRSEYKSGILEKDAEKINLYGFRLQGLDEDLDDLSDDIRDLKSDVSDAAANCSIKDDLLDDSRDLKKDVNHLRDAITKLITEGQFMLDKVLLGSAAAQMALPTSLPKTFINEYGWKLIAPLTAPTPAAAAKQSEIVVSTLNAGPSAPSTPPAALAVTATLDKNQPTWENTRQTVWLVAGVIVLLAVVLFLLGMLFRR